MRLAYLVIWLHLVVTVHSQQLHFHNYPLLDKQVKQPVQLIEQDQTGMIWAASGTKLYQFNGVEYNELSIPGSEQNEISALNPKAIGKVGVYVGLKDGRLLSSQSTNITVLDSTTFQGFAITGAVEDKSGYLWVSTYGGGLYYRKSSSAAFQTITAHAVTDIYSLITDPVNGVWIATDKGIDHCSFVDDKITVRHFGRKEGLPDEIVKSMALDVDGLLLGTHEKGVIRFDFQTQSFEELNPDWAYGSIRAIDLFDEREVWVATERHDVFTIDLISRAINVVKDQNGTSFRQVMDLLIDREGNVWLSSHQFSLLRAFRKFEFYETSMTNVQAAIPYEENRILLGTSSGLFDYDLKSGETRIISNTKALNIVNLHRLGSFVLVGTFDKGAYYIDLNRVGDGVRVIAGLENQSVIAMANSSEDFWFSTLSGLSRCGYSSAGGQLTFTRLKTCSQFTRNYVYDILVESDSSIFFATDGHGVAHTVNDQVVYYTQKEDDNTQIYSIIKGASGKYWVVENTSGLCRLDVEGKLIRCGLQTTGTDITALASDGRGKIIVVHADGIDILDELTKEVNSYGAEFGFDGFASHLNSTSRLDTGNVYVATNSGVIKIIQSKSFLTTPDIAFKFVKVGDRSVDYREPIELNPEEHTIQFGLQGLYYLNPESVVFRYKLEGHDEEWKSTRDKYIIYSKLSPGTYRFVAQATSDYSSDHTSDVIDFEFELLPPLYMRWWFVILLVLVVLVAAVAFVRFREGVIARKKELQKAILERQYEVLKNQLNPHFLFNAFNTLVGYIEEDPKTAVVVVEKLTNFYRKILEVKQYKLVSMEEELELLSDYVYLLNKRFDNNLKLDIQLNGNVGYMPPMTLQILVENAVKHNVLSHAYPLTITIEDVDNESFSITNNIKPKRNVGQSTGIGLKNIDKRYRLLGFDAISVKRDERFFSVVLPKILNSKI